MESTVESKTFKENFWCSELGNFSSYENIIKKLKEEQKATKEYIDSLKQRANAQELYGKSLLKLGKVTITKNGQGILGRNWQNLHNRSHLQSEVLLKSSTAMNQEISYVVEVMNKQRDKRKHEEDEVKQVQMALKAAMMKAQTRQKQYCQKKKEKEQATAVAEQTQAGSKESTKAQQRLQQITQQFESAQTNLIQAEQQLQEARITWQQRTSLSYEVLESLEVQRLDMLVHIQLRILQIETDQQLEINELLSQILQLNEDDVKMEIAHFVENNKTNQEPPCPIQYTIKDSTSSQEDDEAEYDTVVIDTEKYQQSVANTASPSEDVPVKASKDVKEKNSIPGRLLAMIPSTLSRKEKDMMTKGSVIIATQETIKEKQLNPFEDDTDEENETVNTLYDFVTVASKQENTEYAGSYQENLQRVVFNYTAKHDSDISLTEGSLVTLVRYVDEEWAEVRHVNKAGFFPRNYLEPASS